MYVVTVETRGGVLRTVRRADPSRARRVFVAACDEHADTHRRTGGRFPADVVERAYLAPRDRRRRDRVVVTLAEQPRG